MSDKFKAIWNIKDGMVFFKQLQKWQVLQKQNCFLEIVDARFERRKKIKSEFLAASEILYFQNVYVFVGTYW